MLGLRTAHTHPNFTSRHLPWIYSLHNPSFRPSLLALKLSEPRNPKQFRIHAQNSGNSNGLSAGNGTKNGGDGEDDTVKNGGPRFNLRWVDLLFDPDPDNIVAVGLTGLLTWASVQVLWQLFIVSGAILIAALKYAFVAVILIFILITLL